MPDVVITGLGAVTPLGNDVPTTWRGLCEGRSGVATIGSFDASGLPTRIAAEVHDFDPLMVMDAKQARRSGRFSQLAVAAAVQACGDAGLPAAELGPRVGAVINTAVAGMGEIAAAADRLAQRGWRGLRSDFVPSVIPNMPACQVAMRLGIHGPVTAGALACASGNYALVQAAQLIQTGAADVVLAGGTDSSINPLMFGGLSMMSALSRRNDEPTAASRPFDADRDGFVYGEGAVVLVVESADNAASRGARVYARYLGGALTCDGFHVAAPEPSGEYAAAAISAALAAAARPPAAVDYICAHGTGTRANDRTETRAIRIAFGRAADDVAVSSPKSMVGHLIGAAGALSAMAGCLAITDQVVPPTINLDTPDPECDLDYVPKVSRALDVETVLVNAFGFGGQNCVVVLGRP